MTARPATRSRFKPISPETSRAHSQSRSAQAPVNGLAAGETSNIAAQTLVFQARDVSYELTVPALQQSLQLLEKAIALDPNYARAYAIKSFVANNLASQYRAHGRGVGEGPGAGARLRKNRALPRAEPADRALRARFAYALKLQVSDSLREHKIALSLASGDPDVIRNYGYAISSIGKPEEALRYVDEALALDPLNWKSHHAHVSVLFDARRYEEAVRYSLKLKQDSPELFRFPILLGHSLLMLGRTQEAALSFGQDLTGAALLAARSGDRELALAKLAALQEHDREFKSYDSARIYAQLGDKDAAFEELNRAREVRDSSLLRLKVDPYLDPLRGDSRYAALVKRFGLPA